MTQKVIDATTVSAERRKQRLSALGSLAQSTVTFVIFAVAILMILAEMGYNITTILSPARSVSPSPLPSGCRAL